MMKFLMVCAVSLTTILGGCASTGGGPPTQGDVTAIINQVQEYTKLACGFVPTATTILNIIGATVPGVTIATSIAQAICAAVATPMAGKHAFAKKTIKGYVVTPGAVNGVPVEGNKVR